MKPFKDKTIAIKQARSIAKKREKEMYVVYEDGYYHVADEFDLETFFMGTPDQNIVYCSLE